jgi:hypothetical protein
MPPKKTSAPANKLKAKALKEEETKLKNAADRKAKSAANAKGKAAGK